MKHIVTYIVISLVTLIGCVPVKEHCNEGNKAFGEDDDDGVDGDDDFSDRLKGKYHENLLSFQNPKMFVCQQKQRNNCPICYKLAPQ